MELTQVLTELESYGNPSTQKIYRNHGLTVPCFGVKVGDMKKILKKTKKNHQLALALFASGNPDAMYLAGLMADEKRVSAEELEAWAERAEWYMVGEYAVAGLAAESAHGWALGNKWIDSSKAHVASIGWATLGGLVSLLPDEKLDLDHLQTLLERVRHSIHGAPNRVRYTMNGFVIAVGSYIGALTGEAMAVAAAVGPVSVDMGGTACKVPDAPQYIEKMITTNRIGKKRKNARC